MSSLNRLWMRFSGFLQRPLGVRVAFVCALSDRFRREIAGVETGGLFFTRDRNNARDANIAMLRHGLVGRTVLEGIIRPKA